MPATASKTTMFQTTAAALVVCATKGTLENVLRALPDASVSNAKSAAYYRLEKAAVRIAELQKQMDEDAKTLVEDLAEGADSWPLDVVWHAAVKASK